MEELYTKTAEQISQAQGKSIFDKDNDVEIMFKASYSKDKKSFITHEQTDLGDFSIYSHFVSNEVFEELPKPGKPLEYILVVDNSGSMGTTRMEQAKEACKQIVNSLPAGSGFNVIKFGSHYEKMF